MSALKKKQVLFLFILGGIIMLYLLLFLAGIILGAIVSNIIRFERTSFGKLKIDPKENVCQVCLNTEDVIKSKKKKIVLEIDHHADLSQK